MTTYSADGTTAKKAGPRLLVAIIVIIIGTVIGIGGLAVGVAKIVHDISGPTGVTPSPLDLHLGSGTWQVYLENDSDALDQLSSPSDVTVTGANGTTIPVRGLPGDLTETITTGSHSYEAQARFTVTAPGEYSVKIRGSNGIRFKVTKSLGDTAKSAAGWFVAMGFGILIGFVGVILLIVGIVRRRNQRRPAYAGGYPPSGYQPASPAAPAPGWYPDPSVPGSQRYWDGARWTDQTHTPS
jgi:hypothetical protein